MKSSSTKNLSQRFRSSRPSKAGEPAQRPACTGSQRFQTTAESRISRLAGKEQSIFALGFPEAWQTFESPLPCKRQVFRFRGCHNSIKRISKTSTPPDLDQQAADGRTQGMLPGGLGSFPAPPPAESICPMPGPRSPGAAACSRSPDASAA